MGAGNCFIFSCLPEDILLKNESPEDSHIDTAAHRYHGYFLARKKNHGKDKKVECAGRESNPGQLLGRQLCSPLYHRRRTDELPLVQELKIKFKDFCNNTGLGKFPHLTPWRNGSASDSRSEGCVFESRRGQNFGKSVCIM